MKKRWDNLSRKERKFLYLLVWTLSILLFCLFVAIQPLPICDFDVYKTNCRILPS